MELELIAASSTILIKVVVAFAALYLTKLINTKLSGDIAKTAISVLDALSYSAVNYLEQTVVNELKKRSKDGKLLTRDIKLLQDAAIDKVMTNLGKTGQARLKSALGITNQGLTKLVKTSVESKVNEIKRLSTF